MRTDEAIIIIYLFIDAFSSLPSVLEVEEINTVTLYEEVLPDQPIVYAGSDDTFIYAVNMLSGKIKWKIKTLKDTGYKIYFMLCVSAM